MQLVLALHPDQRQTELIAGLVRRRMDVEMVQAASAGEGLQELGDRIPDLILTAPLLSPFDEDVLAEYLRELGSAAAHVQTLRIPVLSTPSESPNGIFSFGRKKRVESLPAGCDPQLFVDEITEYLARAADDRRAAAKAAASADAPQEQAPPLSIPDEIQPGEAAPLLDPEPVDYSYRLDRFPPAEPDYSTERAATLVDDQADAPSFDSAFPVYQPYQHYSTAPEPEPPAAVTAASSAHVDSAFPIYQRKAIAEPAADVPMSEPPVEAYPIYHAAPVAADPPLSEPARSESARSELARSELAASDPSKDEVKDDAFPVYRREQSILEPSTYRTDVHRATSLTSVSPVYQPSPERIEPITQADPLGLHVEDNLDAHASLLLDPPSAGETAQPFVVHSANETLTLSESLERAAAQLEASGLGEPVAREVERVPMHRLTSLDELPLPDVLSARVTQSVARGLSAPMGPTVDVDPSLLAESEPTVVEEHTQPIVGRSAPFDAALLEPAPLESAPAESGPEAVPNQPLPIEPMPIEPPVVFESIAAQAIVEPPAPVIALAAEPVAAPVMAPPASALPPLPAQNTSHNAVEAGTTGPATRRPSFEAALAAIRKAWGRPRRSSDPATAAVSPNIDAPVAEADAAPVVPITTSHAAVDTIIEHKTPMSPTPTLIDATPTPVATQELIAEADAKSGREVDLTLDIDALEEHPVAVDQRGPVLLDPEEIDVVARQVDEDIYELSASPALRDLDADLAAAGPPPPVREVFPVASQPVEPVAEPGPEPVAAPRKRDKQRKKTGKKSKAQAATAPAADGNQPAQDEWGLFDPNQCGFAAVVDKLNEVTNDKDEKPTKTSVRVISYG